MSSKSPRKGGLGGWLLGAVLVLLLVGYAAWRIHVQQLQTELLVTPPDQIVRNADLTAYAETLAKPAYADNCAACHGEDMTGDQQRGAPSLKDNIWLYEAGGVADIERTILYGIRSGHGKSRNITDMPAEGRTLQLTPADVKDVTIFVLSLTRQGADFEAIKRGSAIFQGKGVCYDCHSADARGNPDYGAPDFTDNEWLYGGDVDTVYRSIYSGRHGICPAWTDKLKPAVIRALAVYIHQVSHPAPAGSASGGQVG